MNGNISVFKGNVCLLLLGIEGSVNIIPSSETCTKWQPVSECTVTCGGGTKDVTRNCIAKVKCNEQACRKSLNDCCYSFSNLSSVKCTVSCYLTMANKKVVAIEL